MPKSKISRRTMLRGVGTTLAIAVAGSDAARVASAPTPARRPPLRTIFMYHPLGADRPRPRASAAPAGTWY